MAVLGEGMLKIVRKNNDFVAGIKEKLSALPERKWPTIEPVIRRQGAR
jgi:hypothetical protein